MAKTIRVLDRVYINGTICPLDGNGNVLPAGAETVFIEVPVVGTQRNSRGDVFSPQLLWDEAQTPVEQSPR